MVPALTTSMTARVSQSERRRASASAWSSGSSDICTSMMPRMDCSATGAWQPLRAQRGSFSMGSMTPKTRRPALLRKTRVRFSVLTARAAPSCRGRPRRLRPADRPFGRSCAGSCEKAIDSLFVVDVDGLDARAVGDQLHDVLHVLLAIDQHAVVGGALDQLAKAPGVAVDRFVPLIGDGAKGDVGVHREDDDDGEEQRREQRALAEWR